MSRWFRHYAGMMRDDKLVRAAIKSGQSVERVLWVWGAILESASEIDDGGRYDFDAAEAAYFLRADETDILAIVDTLSGLGRLDKNFVVKWGDRQFQSDRSASRQTAYRERQRTNKLGFKASETSPEPISNVTVTSQSRHRDAPDTETDTDTDTEKETPNGVSKKRLKGTRLPADWKPSKDHFLMAAEKRGFDAERVNAEAEAMRDWAKSTAGQKGVKLDWDATFRNWLRNAREVGRGPPSHGNGSQHLTPHQRQMAAFQRKSDELQQPETQTDSSPIHSLPCPGTHRQ